MTDGSERYRGATLERAVLARAGGSRFQARSTVRVGSRRGCTLPDPVARSSPSDRRFLGQVLTTWRKEDGKLDVLLDVTEQVRELVPRRPNALTLLAIVFAPVNHNVVDPPRACVPSHKPAASPKRPTTTPPPAGSTRSRKNPQAKAAKPASTATTKKTTGRRSPAANPRPKANAPAKAEPQNGTPTTPPTTSPTQASATIPSATPPRYPPATQAAQPSPAASTSIASSTSKPKTARPSNT